MMRGNDGSPREIPKLLCMGFWKTMLEEALRRVLRMGGFFLDGLGCFKLRGIRPGSGER